MKNKTIPVSIFIFSLIALLSCNTVSIPNLFATKTPTPTLTFTPTRTPTSTPTFTPTPIPTFTPTPQLTGTAKEELPDGSVRFIDHDGKYELIIPDQWLAVTLSQKDMQGIIGSLAQNGPTVEKAVEALKNLDPKVFRLFVFDVTPDDISDNFLSNINIALEQNPIVMKLPINTMLTLNKQALSKSGLKITVLSSSAEETAAKLTIGVILAKQILRNEVGSPVTVYQKIVFFHTNTGVVAITFSTLPNMKDKTIPMFDQIIESIKLQE
jgi:hypothetical protein